jgi:hypothetical protein
MALELKDILQTMKKEYGFVVKLACDCDIKEYKSNLECLDTILKAKGMIERSEPKALPLAAQPIVFQRLQGFVGTYYTFDMLFEYPITATELMNEICTLLGLDRAFVIVRTSENPFNKIEEDYLEYDEEDYLPQLITDEMPNDIKEEDLVGDSYNEQLVKKLQSKEAKKYQHQFTEVDTDLFNESK